MDGNLLLQTLISPPEWLTEWVRNFRLPEDAVIDLDSALSQLSSRRESLVDTITAAWIEGLVCTPEVIEWLSRVEICEEEATKIIRQIYCVQCLFFNCWPSQLLRRMHSLTTRQLEVMAPRPLPDAIQEIPRQCRPFGLESHVDKVDRYLANDEVHMVGIWGVGGVGKTTLLQTINNELRPGGRLNQRNTFDHVLFFEVSRHYEPHKLQKGIAKKLRLGCSDVPVNIRAAAISRFLENRKFLLLLDDLWDLVDLEKMGILLHRQNHKVIFTTRYQDVCLQMNPMETIKMEGLDLQNAQALFLHNVGQEAFSRPAFHRLSKTVISKCGGLPLAITMIAKALKTDNSDWRSSIANLRQSRLDEILNKHNRQSFAELYKTLKISYDRLLDDTARQCFLSCALWPEGCPIEKLELIQSWMGLGLLDEAMNDDFDEAYNEGNRVMENLKAACLLERDHTSENKVKMHGVIRDMALWIANENGAAMNKWIVKEDIGFVTVWDNPRSWEAAERISLMSHRLIELPPTLDCPSLSCLMLQDNPGFREIPLGFFPLMVALSFLDLSFTGICKLPEEIGSLLQLHYLNLSNTPISTLPDSLGRLTRLKYLLLNNTRNLTVIQYGLISSLSMLLVLDLFGCGYADWELDDGRSRASLQEFNELNQGSKFLGVTIATSEALDQLSRIPRLRTQHLGIVGWVGETSLQQLMELLSRPRIYENLKQLKVENCVSSKVLTIGDDNGSWHLPRLQVLELHNLIRLTQIIWRAVRPREYLRMIHELKISHCDTLEDVSWILDLQHLERLELSNCKCMKKVVNNDHGIEVGDEEVMNGAFGGLKSLILKELSALYRICDHEYDFLALEYLEVQECQKLQELPFSYRIIENKSLVIHGGDNWWNNLVWNDEVGNIRDYLRFCVN